MLTARPRRKPVKRVEGNSAERSRIVGCAVSLFIVVAVLLRAGKTGSGGDGFYPTDLAPVSSELSRHRDCGWHCAVDPTSYSSRDLIPVRHNKRLDRTR